MLPRFLARRFPVFAARAPILPLVSTRAPLTRVRRIIPLRPFSSSSPRLDSTPQPTFSERVKHLVKSYGWYAIGVYLAIGVVDFGVAFAAVNFLGAEYVGQVTASAKATVADWLHTSRPAEPGHPEMESVRAQSGGYEGLTAMLVLAYTVHKTVFMPVRVGLTAGLTPKLVGWLSRRGWAGKEGTKRAATEVRERIRNSRERDRD